LKFYHSDEALRMEWYRNERTELSTVWDKTIERRFCSCVQKVLLSLLLIFFLSFTKSSNETSSNIRYFVGQSQYYR